MIIVAGQSHGLDQNAALVVARAESPCVALLAA